MIDAELHNKIPEVTNREDILTSNVFGLLGLMDNKYLLDILHIAKNYKNEKIAFGSEISTVELWRKFKNIGEPDVLVTLKNGEFFVIEVKYFSHEHNRKSSGKKGNEDQYEDVGQLAKYLNIKIDNKKSDFIVYLTADYKSLKHIKSSNSSSKKHLDQIYHIHWEEFNGQLQKIETIQDPIEEKIVHKIIQYLDYKVFEYWKGFSYKKAYKINITTKGFYECE